MYNTEKLPFWNGLQAEAVGVQFIKHSYRGLFQHRETEPLDGLDLAEETDEEYARNYVRFL